MEKNQSPSLSGEQATMLPPATGSSHINLTDAERVVSTLGGAALTMIGLKKLNSISGIALLLGGGVLLSRGLSGYCAITNYLREKGEGLTKNASAIELETTLNIDMPRSTVYSFWRKLENLPQFMKHLYDVTELDDKRSKWTANLPGNVAKVSWEAEIVEDISGELIAWNSLPGSTVDNAGEVRFKDTKGGQATELQVRISYRLPGGDVGTVAAKLFNPAVEKVMHNDIKNFKRVIEHRHGPSGTEERTSDSPVNESTDDELKIYR